MSVNILALQNMRSISLRSSAILMLVKCIEVSLRRAFILDLKISSSISSDSSPSSSRESQRSEANRGASTWAVFWTPCMEAKAPTISSSSRADMLGTSEASFVVKSFAVSAGSDFLRAAKSSENCTSVRVPMLATPARNCSGINSPGKLFSDPLRATDTVTSCSLSTIQTSIVPQKSIIRAPDPGHRIPGILSPP